MSKARVFIYVQHLLGIGHLVRISRVAEALVDEGFDVTLATGGCPVDGFPGERIRTIALPPVRAGTAGFSALEDCGGKPVDGDFKAARTRMLLSAFEAARPDAVIVEAFPFGRRMMRFELLPLLDLARAIVPRPLVACSIRDILQENQKPGRAAETGEAIAKYFDIVLVHGDPKFARLEESFGAASAFREKLAYTGFVAGPPPAPSADRYEVVVSAGGGAVGAELLTAAMAALKPLAASKRCCVVTGQQIAERDFSRMKAEARGGLEVFRFRSDLPALFRNCELSISQAGYNTVCDILQAGCRSLLVPFARDGETEQTQRAARLAKLGAAKVIPEHGITAEAISAAASTLLRGPRPAAHGLDLDGARRTARLLSERLTTRGQSA